MVRIWEAPERAATKPDARSDRRRGMVVYGAIASSNASDTWGISGPAFLVEYLLLAVAAYWVARWLFAPQWRGPKETSVRPGSLTSPEWGMLRQPRAAVAAALAELLTDGWLRETPSGCHATGRGRQPFRTPLHAAVLTAFADAGGQQPSLDQLLRHPAVTRELSNLRTHMQSVGLLTTPARERLARGITIVMTLVFALGLARLLAGWAGHKPITDLAVLLVGVAVVTVKSWLAPPMPTHVTRAGARLVEAKATANADLVVSTASRKSGYVGAAARDVGLSVALFGTSALVLAHPAAAAAMRIDHVTFATLSSGSSGYDSTTSSSCGGGGCGGCGG